MITPDRPIKETKLNLSNFDGNMDDITNGITYVKTENNLTDAMASKVNRGVTVYCQVTEPTDQLTNDIWIKI